MQGECKVRLHCPIAASPPQCLCLIATGFPGQDSGGPRVILVRWTPRGAKGPQTEPIRHFPCHTCIPAWELPPWSLSSILTPCESKTSLRRDTLVHIKKHSGQSSGWQVWRQHVPLQVGGTWCEELKHLSLFCCRRKCSHPTECTFLWTQNKSRANVKSPGTNQSLEKSYCINSDFSALLVVSENTIYGWTQVSLWKVIW